MPVLVLLLLAVPAGAQTAAELRQELGEARKRVSALEEELARAEASELAASTRSACAPELGAHRELVRRTLNDRYRVGSLPAPADLSRWRYGCLEGEQGFGAYVLAGKVQFGELLRAALVPVGARENGRLSGADFEAVRRCLEGKTCLGQSFERPRASPGDEVLQLTPAAGLQQRRLRRSGEGLVLTESSSVSLGVRFGWFGADYVGP